MQTFIDNIYEVTMGDPKSGLRYTVGRTYTIGGKSVTISLIDEDVNESGVLYVYKWEDEEHVLWKKFWKVPYTLSKDINENKG